jgi:hypothetical protein
MCLESWKTSREGDQKKKTLRISLTSVGFADHLFQPPVALPVPHLDDGGGA